MRVEGVGSSAGVSSSVGVSVGGDWGRAFCLRLMSFGVFQPRSTGAEVKEGEGRGGAEEDGRGV